jgi:hypothetical protein
MKRLLLLLAGSLLALIGLGAGRAAAWQPRVFEEEMILGWRVKIDAEFRRDHPRLVQSSLDLLQKELAAIVAALPPQRLGQLRQATFWLDERVPRGPASAKVPVFHPSRDWLQEHGLNPDMAGGVELPNARAFLESYAVEPWALMHELAHFYHHVVIGLADPRIPAAYHHARDAGLYEHVAYHDGRMMRAYALENEKEYFAELTEAYFGRNDFYPFARDELRHYDAEGFALMEEIWEAP